MEEEKGIIQTGRFILEGNMFLMNGRKLVIKNRKEPQGKPERYLIGLSPFQYISSLFPDPEQADTFTFDMVNVFKLVIQGNELEISIVE